jgi:hypothetical protein
MVTYSLDILENDQSWYTCFALHLTCTDSFAESIIDRIIYPELRDRIILLRGSRIAIFERGDILIFFRANFVSGLSF